MLNSTDRARIDALLCTRPPYRDTLSRFRALGAIAQPLTVAAALQRAKTCTELDDAIACLGAALGLGASGRALDLMADLTPALWYRMAPAARLVRLGDYAATETVGMVHGGRP